jgi:hypothetical protein
VDTVPVDRVVVDLRENGGGSSSVLVPLLAGLEQRAAAGRLNLRTQLVGLINAGTFSAAMDNATLIRALGGRLAGQPTLHRTACCASSIRGASRSLSIYDEENHETIDYLAGNGAVL